MAMNAFLTLDGEVQGPIHGDSTVGGDNENDIEVLEFHHEVSVSDVTGSSLDMSRRVHHPLTVTKRFDQSSPKLYLALTSNERITTATLKFYRPNPIGDGTREHFFTITMRSAVIVSVKPNLPNTLNQATSSLPATEDVSFAYRTISWTYETGGIEHEDDWDVNPSS